MNLSDREQLLGDRPAQPPTQYGAATPTDLQSAESALQQQQTALNTQSADLTKLSGGVGSVKRYAGLIHDEVQYQNYMLDNLESGINNSVEHVSATRERAINSAGSAYNIKSFCLLLWPLVLLFVLVVEAVLYFLF